MHHGQGQSIEPSTVSVDAAGVPLAGDLAIPGQPLGVIVFAHSSGSERLTPRNRAIAQALVRDGFATLVLDLLTSEEQIAERHAPDLRFDIRLLARRLTGAVEWVTRQERLATLPIGLFGANTGTAAALITATRTGTGAVVSRGGRPDLAGAALPFVLCPTLFIVGGHDVEIIEHNRSAMKRLAAPAALHIVPHAGHLFDEPGALHEVIDHASAWFRRHLVTSPLRKQYTEQWDH